MTDIVRDVFVAFVRVHVLHHASEQPIYGRAMIDELARHGYRLSPGTLYPIFRGLADRIGRPSRGDILTLLLLDLNQLGPDTEESTIIVAINAKLIEPAGSLSTAGRR